MTADQPRSYQGPMPEDEYLAVVERIQQAMAIEPFQPSVIDVVKLLADWRTLSDDLEAVAIDRDAQVDEVVRLREAGLKLAAETATSEALKDAEIERLRAVLEQVRDDVAGEITLQRGGNGPWIPAKPDDPLIVIVERIDAALAEQKAS